MNTRTLIEWSRRELRGSASRLFLFAACLAVGVGAIVGVAGLADSLDRAIRQQARPLLAADVVVRGRRALPDELDGLTEGFRRADVLEMGSVVRAEDEDAGEGSLLAELKAVSGPYPFYGDLVLEPAAPLAELLAPTEGDPRYGVAVGASLLQRLELEVGDPLFVGGQAFAIRAVVEAEPDRVTAAFTVGPRVLLSIEGIETTGLVGFGSRVTHKALFETGSEEESLALSERLESDLPDASYYRVETAGAAQPSLRQGLGRVELFLSQVALLSLLVGGVGVARTVRAWLATRMQSIAVFRSLGATPGDLTLLYLLQIGLLAALGSFAGIALGVGVLALAPLILGDMLPPGVVRLWQPMAMLRGMGMGVSVALLFALGPLLQLRQVSPLAVLRRDVEPLPLSLRARIVRAVVAIAGLYGVAWVQSGDPALAALFLGSVALTTLALVVVVGGVMQVARRSAHQVRSFRLRQGLLGLSRPGADTVAAAVALGLGILVVTALLGIQQRLAAQLDEGFPERAPTAFLVDVQPDQWPGVEQQLDAVGAEGLRSSPVVMARIHALDGVLVSDMVAALPEEGSAAEPEGPGSARGDRWALTREQRLSYLEELPDDNEIVAGSLWSDPSVFEVSLEDGFAESLGVGLGSVIEFDVQGIPIELTVTSLRTVEWQSFNMNFFLVAEPGVLEAAPQFELVAARLSEEGEEDLRQHLAQNYPNVTLISVRSLLTQVAELLGRLGWGVRLLGGFSALAGILILVSSASAESNRRRREVALLKTIGVTRPGIIGLFAVEYGLLGTLSGLVGALGGAGLAWLTVEQILTLEYSFSPLLVGGLTVACALLVVAAGVLGNLRALTVPPRAALAES